MQTTIKIEKLFDNLIVIGNEVTQEQIEKIETSVTEAIQKAIKAANQEIPE